MSLNSLVLVSDFLYGITPLFERPWWLLLIDHSENMRFFGNSVVLCGRTLFPWCLLCTMVGTCLEDKKWNFLKMMTREIPERSIRVSQLLTIYKSVEVESCDEYVSITLRSVISGDVVCAMSRSWFFNSFSHDPWKKPSFVIRALFVIMILQCFQTRRVFAFFFDVYYSILLICK